MVLWNINTLVLSLGFTLKILMTFRYLASIEYKNFANITISLDTEKKNQCKEDIIYLYFTDEE